MMEFTQAQKEKFFRNGYIRIPGAASTKQVNMALRAINHSISKGIDPERIEEFRADSYCPELRRKSEITDLLHKSDLLTLAGSLTSPDSLRVIGGGQIALRFPIMEHPGGLHAHIDGMYRPGNKVRKGKIFTFTMLAGVFLSDVPNRFWGNFTVWPGTHRLYEQYYRKNGYEVLYTGLPPVKMPEPEQLLAKAGDALLCHYQLAHTAVSNVSPFIRYAVFFRLSHSDHSSYGKKVFSDIWSDWEGMREVVRKLESREHED